MLWIEELIKLREKQRGYPTSEILLMTGLPESEIEKL